MTPSWLVFARIVLLWSISGAAFAAQYKLAPTPQTVAWGYYWAEAKPVLTIQSGDTVQIQTVSGNPETLEKAGVPAAQIQPELRRLHAEVPKESRGPGGHLLTGPIAITGAQPGDVLEVRIREIRMDVPYAYNGFGRAGFLADLFPPGNTRIIALDRTRKMGHFAAGIDIPLKPFFGSMGVAPPASDGKINSAPPGIHAGNLDNKELVAGTTLFIPVHAPGALFEVGDGHAGQGDGEVDITAMETSLTGVFEFIVRHDMHLKWPRAETPTHYITMGLDPDLTQAARLCTLETIDFLVNEKKLTREEAYALTSVAIDLEITQLVDGTRGVHAMIAKSLFHAAAEPRP
ncbi:MAG: acetamidase/formamidase family protein [Acidobacteriia bacterium]|nr:acetamidase/formamidase family protein [Terriglobia bacterium]MBV8907042.1 acetamidase/formamidase family protein [Terriglobia bacterium]